MSDWRTTPGFFATGHSDFESVHVLLGRFLADRYSSDPLPDTPLLAPGGSFAWGSAPPLEKVIDSPENLHRLMQHPLLYRNSIAIVEPWEHVGFNDLGEQVRASVNVTFIAQKIADCDSYLVPLWSSGPFDLDQLVPLITSGLAVVVEGGNPSVRDRSSFDGSRVSLDDMSRLAERLLLARSPTSATALFVCLGHQLAAQAHVGLLQRAVSAVLGLTVLPGDRSGKLLRPLAFACERIQQIGSTLAIRKGSETVAKGWDDSDFAVGPNELPEIGDTTLHQYHSPDPMSSGVPQELISAHEVSADDYEGVIDTTLRYEHNLHIAMFHNDEVNEEAMLFANWAYRLLHDAIAPYRYMVAGSELSWLLQLPDALEILCSTVMGEQPVTECSATSIYYRDFETKRVRRSFTCQFHPELLADLRVIGVREAPSYAELKDNDGARLLARLLYEGMQE